MSRISDVQGVVKGFAKVGACSCQRNVQSFSLFYQNIYIQPVLQQALKIVLDIKDPKLSGSINKQNSFSKSQGLDLKLVVANIPVVIQGMGIFANFLVTGNYTNSLRSSSEQLSSSKNTSDNAQLLNTSISALDLLEFDLTNADLLKKKLFIDNDSDPASKSNNFSEVIENPREKVEKIGALKPSDLNKLKTNAKERSVPSSRISRVANFASLGVGLGLGIAAEASRRVVGVRSGGKSGAKLDGSIILTEANAERIVSTLCRVRGAALKLGQMLSIQDGAVVGPELQKIFDRVRESADYMPEWQLESVMQEQLGHSWRDRFRKFDIKPFAAASIGQVHYAELHDGTAVAVKVQYPGVAKSIDSDINNLISLVSVLAILPKGLFLDNIAKHMRQELREECDYAREANCGQKMKQILSGYSEYYVPTVYPDNSSDQVLVAELISGLTIDNCVSLPQNTRNFIAESILKLVLRELFLHRFMQTDPNWANFLYNPDTEKIGLLDFGATREYKPEFVNTYFKIIDSAVDRNREDVLKYSREVGFLTGYESQAMNDAHVDSVMLLAVPFQENSSFNFGSQKITQEIQEKTSIMLRERLCPPPQEVYSLHRKLSGLFLLAGKLNSEFNCFIIWQDIRRKFKPFPVVV